MIDVPTAAMAANVSERTIRRWIAAGMPSSIVNGQRRIDLDDLGHWVLRMSRACHSMSDTSVVLSSAPPTSGASSLDGTMSTHIHQILDDYDLTADDREAIAERILQATQPRPQRSTRVVGPPETR